MAINYGAGFLPQGLYNNISNTLQQGYADRRKLDEKRMENLGGFLGNLANYNVQKGEKAKERLTKNYETQRKRLQDQMTQIDPRSPKMGLLRNQINNLDNEYTQAIENFEGTGFLKMGRDQSQLGIGDYQGVNVTPGDTRAEFANLDAARRLRDQNTINNENLLPAALAKVGVSQNPVIQQEEQRLYGLQTKRDDEKSAKQLERDLSKIQAQGDQSLRGINAQQAGADRRAALSAGRGEQIEKLRMDRLQAQIANDQNMAELRLKMAEAQAQPKPPSQEKIFRLAMDLTKSQFGPDQQPDPVMFQKRFEANIRDLTMMMGGGPQAFGPEKPKPGNLFENPEKGAEGEGPKVTKLTKNQADRLESQIRDVLDRADGIFGFGKASPEMQQHVSVLATNQRRAIDMYNQTPDSNKDLKAELAQRITEYSKAINEAANLLDR